MSVELLGFMAVSFVIAVTPGPSVVYVVSYSLRYGARAGMVSTLGVNAGSILFILLATFGLSSLVERFPMSVVLIQLAGGLYVTYLAAGMWPRDRSRSAETPELTRRSHAALFANGFVTSVLNPKDLLFYTAFIPAFIPKEAIGPDYRAHFMALAFSYMLIGLATKSAFALFAGSARQLLAPENMIALNRIASGTLGALGAYIVGGSLWELAG